MKNFLLVFVTAFLLVACKTKNDKVQDFVKMYNRSSDMMHSPMIRSTKATSSNAEEVNIEVNTSYQSNDMESSLVSSALPDLIGQAIKSDPLGKELFESGVKFNLKVYGSDARVIVDKTIDQKNLDKSSVDFNAIAKGDKPNSTELNQILEVFNKNLPMEDKATGTKIISIKADENNNIVYTNEVPESFKTMLQQDGAEQMLKDEMLRSPQIQQIFARTSVLGVNNLKYIYTDTKGNVIKEVTISKNDVK